MWSLYFMISSNDKRKAWKLKSQLTILVFCRVAHKLMDQQWENINVESKRKIHGYRTGNELYLVKEVNYLLAHYFSYLT